MTNRKEVEEIWPELGWIQDSDLGENTPLTWMLAFHRSPLKPQDLREISFTQSVEGCKVFLHARTPMVVQLARDSALKMSEFMGDDRGDGKGVQSSRIAQASIVHDSNFRIYELLANSDC